MAGGELRPASIEVKAPSGSTPIAVQRWRTALTVLLLLKLCSLPASAQNSVAWTTNYYSVTGTTLPEIRQSIRQSRPWKERLDADGWTDWHVAWRFAVTPSQNGCRCSSFTTQTTIRITMPRWLATTNAPDSVTQAWQKYAAALGQHEAGHAHLALAAAADLQRRIKEIGEGPDCEGLKQRINSLGEQIVEQHRKRDREYDERTNHGASQGAFLPGRMRPNR